MKDWYENYKELVFSSETSVEKIEQAIRLKYDHLPELLYKYRAVNDFSLKNLEEDSVWLSDPKNFNDPYDCSFKKKDEINPNDPDFVIELALNSGVIDGTDSCKIDLIRSSLNPTETLLELSYPDKPEYGRSFGRALGEVVKEQGLKLTNELSENMKQTFKVCSFSENPYSILMWSHYADFHKGFCIAYDFGSLGNEDMRTRLMSPVIYSDEMFDASGIFGRNKTVNNILYINQAALVKSKEWAYEKEWRLVFGNMTLQNEMSFRVPKAKYVILGTKISAENAEKIRKICDKKGIEVKNMSMSPMKYSLTY
ncbi:DUF2971 domain-containing protein [Aliivibrio fischeri]|uniref:DUF2971 domain-containing protein n=1 Tax=Aliivibrio fischeri TaxID=668 RepID=UPI0012D9DFE0|nr:DUF2971 domain-containing protein [Aliivibrio fischeri]MUK78949.1 DUF2971 domain-containing protein [Aliivibrio fischeri]